jgi:glutamate synthase (NADPH) large chain
MSGGLAFVLDEHDEFGSKVNAAMLDQLEELTEEDADEARVLVEEHLRRTGSPVARRVLDSWQQLLPRFVKVFPTDYKRVLAEQAADAERFEPAASTGGDGFVGNEAAA